jgi:hypothetical protein
VEKGEAAKQYIVLPLRLFKRTNAEQYIVSQRKSGSEESFLGTVIFQSGVLERRA